MFFSLFYTFLSFSLFFIQEYPRHNSIGTTLDFLSEDHLIDLNDKNSCYVLREGMTLLQKDPDYPTSPESLAKGAPEGSVMSVSETKFDPNQHFNECRKYSGYVITLNGTKEWVLTSVQE